MTVRKKHLERAAPGTLELARKEGYRRGLDTARTLMLRAKNVQAARAKDMGEANADLRDESEHAAGVLHELCNKVTDLIKASK